MKVHYIRTDRSGNLWHIINNMRTWVCEANLSSIFDIESISEFYHGQRIDYDYLDVIVKQAYLIDIISYKESLDEEKLKDFKHVKIYEVNNDEEVPYFIQIFSKIPFDQLRFKECDES